MTTYDPGQVEFTQDEKRAILKNDARVREQGKERGSTFAQFAESEATEIHGRFAGREKSVVVGSQPNAGAVYPAGPTWSQDVAPPEPPLGVDVNAVDAVGTFSEVQQSLERLGAADLLPGQPNEGEGRSDNRELDAVVVERPRRTKSNKRRRSR
jgi:hypothetical protein